MSAQSTEGTGHGSAEGQIRGLEIVAKILKKNANEVAFTYDAEGRMRSQVESGGSALASEVIVVPTGNLTSEDVQAALEEHQVDIDAASSDLSGKADKVSSPIIGDFAGLDGNGNLTNSGKGPDDYYTQIEVDALTYDHESLTGLQGGASSDHKHLTAANHTNLTGGTPSFTSVTLSGSVDNNTDAATKGYVDGAVVGISDWLEAVLDFKTEAAATETLGFRYIASADGATWTENNVYEYNGSGWDETVVVSGNSTYVDAESAAYVFNGTIWTKTGGISDHNSLSGLQGGEASNYWHLKEDAKTFAESVNITSVANHEFLQYNSVAGKWINVIDPSEVTLLSTDTDLDSSSVTTGVYLVNTSGGNVTITISNSAAINSGDRMAFYKNTSDGNHVIVTTVGGVQEIGGYTSQEISKNYQGFSVTSYWAGASGSWSLIGDTRSHRQIVTVSTVEGEADYTTIADAIAQINSLGDASASKQYVIQLTPGTFTEAPFTVPDYVSIMGINDEVTFVKASNNAATFITLEDKTTLYDFTVDGPTSDVAVYSQNENEIEIVHLSFMNSQTCIQSDTTNGQILIKGALFRSSCTNGLHATNDSFINATNVYSEATGNAYFADGGTLLLHNSYSSGATNHLYCDNDGLLKPHLVICIGGTNVVRTGTNGTNIVYGILVTADSDSTWHILQEAASGDLILTGCTFLSTKLSMVDANNVRIDFNNEFEGDEGHIYMEELSVGSPEQGRETVLGEGDSYTRGMLVCTETSGNVFVDVSTAAASVTSSTFTFTDVTADNAIYISSDLQDSSDYKQFLGIKVSIETAAVLGAGEIVAEYWDGTSWTEFNHMSALSDSPYTQKANAIFERTGSEQIRFQDLSLDAADWTKNDPLTTGTNRFWVRFRIATGITTAPIFEQFKVHSNRTEINADGFLEYMGKARVERILESINLGNTIPISGKSPGNHTIDFGPSIVFNAQGNQFSNNASDGFGQAFGVPDGLDTSMPLKFIVRWAPHDDKPSADVVLDLVFGQSQLGLELNGSNTEITISQTTTTTANTGDIIYATEFEFSITSSLPASGVFFMLQRQATGATGSTGDTYNGDIYIVNTELFGWFWN